MFSNKCCYLCLTTMYMIPQGLVYLYNNWIYGSTKFKASFLEHENTSIINTSPYTDDKERLHTHTQTMCPVLYKLRNVFQFFVSSTTYFYNPQLVYFGKIEFVYFWLLCCKFGLCIVSCANLSNPVAHPSQHTHTHTHWPPSLSQPSSIQCVHSATCIQMVYIIFTTNGLMINDTADQMHQ